ncbi:MAG: hypothetical protein WDM96_16920 [Lacunisphaera sp.]
MKRFVWFLLAAFCTALAQVQPVAAPVTKQAVCGCCDKEAGACGMPDCALPPASAPAAAVVASPVILQRESDSVLPKSRSRRDHFYARFAPRPAVPAEIAPRVVAPAASVPAFQAHCSFLI